MLRGLQTVTIRRYRRSRIYRIGSGARAIVADGEHVVTIDKLTYAGNLDNLAPVLACENHVFVRADICDRAAMATAFAEHCPQAVYHLAAESHVDRTIDAPTTCVETNIVGTATLLEVALRYWRSLDAAGRALFRFLQVSTDEVYGELGLTGQFTDQSRYSPSSPYSASKAGAVASPALGTGPTDCRCWFRIARTITAPISFRKS